MLPPIGQIDYLLAFVLILTTPSSPRINRVIRFHDECDCDDSRRNVP